MTNEISTKEIIHGIQAVDPDFVSEREPFRYGTFRIKLDDPLDIENSESNND